MFAIFALLLPLLLTPTQQEKKPRMPHEEIAVLGGGCFWCVEAIYAQLPGVKSVTSGYSGGGVANPTYEQVCTGSTGHAEVAKIVFDPTQTSYEKLLETFWHAHDPTTLNRQGADVGTQYRSVIFYHDEAQREVAEKVKKEFAPTIWDDPIVTEITAAEKFYKAEDYHQNYFNDNPGQGYCRIVINPKVQKFREKYTDLLKD